MLDLIKNTKILLTYSGDWAKLKKVICMAVFSNENSCFFERKRHIKPMTMPSAHYHDTHELYFLEKGQTKYFIGNEIYMLQPGDMVFIPKFVFHKTDNGQNRVERLRFSFDDNFAGSDCQRYIDELKEKRFIRIPEARLDDFKSIIERLEKENVQKKKGYEDMQSLCFMQMLILISRYCTASGTNLGKTEQTAQSIAKYISENFSSDLSLEVLAEKYSMSPCHLSRMFKKAVGISLCEYINISRITAAERLLRNMDMTVTQIATECGFNDSNYFATVFKRLKGVTPKKYSLERRG